MNKNKRLKYVCLILATLLTLMIACTTGGPNTTDIGPDRAVYDPNRGVDLNSPVMDIVKDGSTEYLIVIPENPTEAESFAASELSTFIRQSLSVNMQVETEKASKTYGKVISLGKTAALSSTGFTFDYDSLNTDGFYIRTHGSNVFIEAGNDRGILYGVYEFLERFIGVRFLTSDHTYIPQIETLSVHSLDIKEVPLFRMRNFYYAHAAHDHLFAARSRIFADLVSGKEQDVKYGMHTEWSTTMPNRVHNTYYYVPYEIYGKDYPHFYSKHTNPNSTYNEICFSNGINAEGKIDFETEELTVAKVAFETLKSLVINEPYAKFFFMGKMDDGGAYCTCEDCQASDAKYTKAGTHVIFINAMAEAISEWAAEEFEDEDKEVNLAFFAYNWSEPAPSIKSGDGYEPIDPKVVLRDNVYVRVAPIKANYAWSFVDERQDSFYSENFKAWGALTSNFMVWDYTANFQEYLWYYPDLSILQENINYYNELGTMYLMQQSAQNEKVNWQTLIKGYVATKLYWNPNRDVWELANEFIELYYGDIAAPYIKEYIALMEMHFNRLRHEEDIVIYPSQSSLNSPYLSSELYPLEFLEAGYNILTRARSEIDRSSLKAADKEVYDKKVAAVLLTPQRMILRNYEAYYSDGRDLFAQEFFDNCDYTGILRINELTLIADIK